MSFLINPFVFAAAGGDFESIATVTVGSGGASSIEFTSIPSTFAHLQIRATVDLGAAQWLGIRVNGSTSTTVYRDHRLSGNGATATAGSFSGDTFAYSALFSGAGEGAVIYDILDYASTTKTTVLRTFAGQDTNGAGEVTVGSVLFNSTAAVTSVRLHVPSGTNNLLEHSTAALYGIKA
jgi:hypothetical protein